MKGLPHAQRVHGRVAVVEGHNDRLRVLACALAATADEGSTPITGDALTGMPVTQPSELSVKEE